MKIEAIETLRLSEFGNLLWVHLHTDTGIVGLGETFFGPQAVEAHIHETVAPLLLGRDPLEIERISRQLQRGYLGFTGTGVEMRAASAIDLALWDIFGKSTGLPVWQLLGGLARPSVRIYNTCAGYKYIRSNDGQRSDNWGLPQKSDTGPYEDLDAFLNRADELARSLLDQGITAMKIWPFDPAAEASDGRFISDDDLEIALEPFRKIRAAVGGKMEIMCELHSLWDPGTAERIMTALAPLRPYWIEDPIKMTSAKDLACLRQRTRLPVCGSETLATRSAFREFLEADALDFVMLDLAWCGGLSEAKKIATLAETWNKPVAPHDCTGPVVLTASCHLSLNATNGLIQETVRAFTTGWYTEVVDTLPKIERGRVYPSRVPGLGLALKPERFAMPDCHRRLSAA
ncbi:MAG: mandelate racemase/muconate lactonizing enzyme family protein [Alphaproteobacteria bacterium]|nr:mandelate racemase/muconate lactonizing enzyme family protein [Alphaproteobacteria bacterium]